MNIPIGHTARCEGEVFACLSVTYRTLIRTAELIVQSFCRTGDSNRQGIRT